MYRCLNAGAVGIHLDWQACLPLARAHGFEGVDLPLDPAVPADTYRQALAAHGLRPGGNGLPVEFRQDEAKCAAGLAALPAIAKHAATVGQTRFATWLLSFSDTLPYQEHFRLLADRLGRAARILADHGCTLGLEFLGPRTIRDGHRYVFAHTSEQMLELCAAVGPNVGLLLDSWHWHTSLGTVSDLLAMTPNQIVYVHINDAPPGVPMEQHLDFVRAVPGETGVIDLPGFLDALRRIGYDGPVVPEPFVDFGKATPEAIAARVGAGLDRVWNRPPRAALPAKMKAVAVGRKKAWLVDVPVPRPQAHEVVVKLTAAPICGSNMGCFNGDGECVNVGHEGAGEVVAVAHSNLLKVGDRVALAPLSSCGRCDHCRRGDVIFCQQRPSVMGDFAQYTLTADMMCTPLPDDVDDVHGSLLGCCLGPPNEALKQLGVRAFDTLVITGLGPVGLGATALASFMGARVVVADPEPWRRSLATKLGAAMTLDPTAADFRAALGDAVGRGGILKAVDCCGRGEMQRLLLDLAGIRAIIAFVGENAGTIAVSPSNDFIRKGLRVLGCWHTNVLDAPDLLTFLRRAPEKADLLISHRFPFSEAQRAFDTFASRQCSKVILLPWA